MRKRALLFGLGRQGFRILELALGKGIEPIDVVDKRPEALRKAKGRFGEKIRILSENPLDLEEKSREDLLSRYEIVLDALPSSLSYRLIVSAINAGARLVSVSFLEEDFMCLDSEARRNGALVIPDCGGAPGFSHMMAGYSVKHLGGADRVTMKVGAIPAMAEPPFYHSLTWSVEDLLEEYFRPAKCRHNGRLEAPDPFTSLEEEKIQGIALQSFLSDGARSFLSNYPNIPFVEERTLRHHGHMEFMSPFRATGFLSRELIDLDGMQIPACRILAEMIEKTFSKLGREDRFLMQILVSRGEKTHRHEYNMPYNQDSKIFGLVNSVAVTAVETAAMIMDQTIRGEGVVPLELLARQEVFDRMTQAHLDKGATVELKIS